LITVISASPLVWIVCTQSRCASVSGVSARMLVIPMTPFIGVRISWLMMARNSLFARSAAWAFRASSCSWATASTSRSWLSPSFSSAVL
jgi:hypothetical protein